MVTDVVCAECGAANEPGEDFCGECGTYLEWDAQAAAAAAPEPEPAPAPEPAPQASPGLLDRVKAAVGLEHDEESAPEPSAAEPSAPEPAATEPAPPPSEPAPAPATPTATAPPAAPSKPAPPDSRAAALLAKPPAGPAGPAPTKPTATAVRPGAAAPKPRKRTAAPLDQPLQPGDLVCGSCGAGNKPTRKFCRRCGKDLAEAEVATIPWHRRLLARKPRAARTAGARPTQKRRLRMPPIARYLAILVVLSGLVYLTKPVWSPALESGLDRVKGVEAVTPSAYTASSSAPGHAARRVRDGESNSYWAPAQTGRGRGQFVELGLDAPTRLVYVLVTPGAGSKDKAFLREGRPTRLRATMFDSDDEVVATKEFRLEDKAGAQQRRIAASDVVKVRFTVLQSHLGESERSRVAIAEVELFQRK